MSENPVFWTKFQFRPITPHFASFCFFLVLRDEPRITHESRPKETPERMVQHGRLDPEIFGTRKRSWPRVRTGPRVVASRLPRRLASWNLDWFSFSFPVSTLISNNSIIVANGRIVAETHRNYKKSDSKDEVGTWLLLVLLGTAGMVSITVARGSSFHGFLAALGYSNEIDNDESLL